MVVITGILLAGTRIFFRKEEAKKDALRRIRERGYIIALSDRNTLNYFVNKGLPMGYQLELLQSFGKFLGVPVKVVVSDNMDQLKHFMDCNYGDILALNLPVTSTGKQIVKYPDPLGETRLVMVRRKAAESNVETDTIYVRSDPFLEPLYHSFEKKTDNKIIIRELNNVSQERLIIKVAKGDLPVAIVQENIAMVFHRNFPNLDISQLAFPLFSYSWGINRHSDSLRMKVNEWLLKEKKSGDLKYSYLSYFQNDRINGIMRGDYNSITGKKLSPFDETIKNCSRLIAWDWRLVASLIYQESNFQSGLTSSRSAHGLMQLMPATAAKFGVDSASVPARQIAAGVRYLQYLDKQLPEEITDPIERIYFILATYNVGIGRVMAAREKAEKYGKDKNRWNRHVDYYLLRRSKKDPVGQLDSTDLYPVDLKNEGFTDDVVGRYFHYRNLIK